MAASEFPRRKAQGAGGMTQPGAGQEALDGPPPSPVMANVGAPQPGVTPEMPSFAQMAQPLTPGTPGRAVSPEVAMGLMSSAETIYGMLDSMAGIMPDLAADFALQKDLLQRSMAKMFQNGGQPGQPGGTGLNFPGGGFAGGSM